MGTFTDTKYIKTIDSLVDAAKDKIRNPYYLFTDKKPTKVTYYAQNVEMSTIDEASGLYGSHLGHDSPIKFNKISDFIIYGMSRINIGLDTGDFGTESSDITGDEVVILPNTIMPRPGDFFSVPYLNEDILFKVTGVNEDTLDTGANIFVINYILDKVDAIDRIEAKVVKRFNFIVNNVGTDFKTIIRDCDYDLIEKLEGLVEELIIKFNNIFFDPKLQTFIVNFDGWLMHDPFLIEFLSRNSVLKFGSEFIYVSHAMTTNRTFSMDYMRSFFYCLENPNHAISCSCYASADMINDPNSLFAARLEDYYWIRHVDNSGFKTRIRIFDMDVIEHITNHEYYEDGNDKAAYNLWIAYFNNDKERLNGNLVDVIRNIDYMENMDYFYMLPITIFILEQHVKSLLAK